MSLGFIQNVKSQASDPKKGDGEDIEGGKRSKTEFNLQDAINETIRKMKKDKGDDNTKRLPENFENFAESDQFKELLEAMLDYNRELFRLENKQQVLEQEAKTRNLPIP